MNVNAYIKASTRDIFQWECIETTDGCGMGRIAVEEVILKGRTVTITRESENEFEVDIILKHPITYDDEEAYEVIDYRTNRKSARMLAERLIKDDLKKDIEINDGKIELMKHCLGLDGSNKPYRNRFIINENGVWNDLVEKKLAKYCDDSYKLTKFGVEFVLGRNISDKFYEEL